MTDRIARRLMGLAAGLALSVATLPALAADMGGIKDYGGAGGVPVPAPVPVAEYDAEWYIGIVGGGVLVDDSTIEEIGAGIAVHDEPKRTLFGGITAGRYLTPNLRGELAFDFYDDFSVAGPSEQHYTDTAGIEGTTYVGHYDVTRNESVKVGRTTGMFNLIYDIPLSERIKPYIGGGVGVSWKSMKRRVTEHAVCDFSTDENDNTFRSDNCAGIPSDLRDYTLTDHTYETDRFDVALAAMAGISVQVSDGIYWDNGYHVLWESNSIALTTPTHAGGTSTVSYGDTVQHQFRTGLRFDIE